MRRDDGDTLLGGSESSTRTEKKKVYQLYTADIIQRVEAITPEHPEVQAILEEFPAKRPVSITTSHANYLISATLVAHHLVMLYLRESGSVAYCSLDAGRCAFM